MGNVGECRDGVAVLTAGKLRHACCPYLPSEKSSAEVHSAYFNIPQAVLKFYHPFQTHTLEMCSYYRIVYFYLINYTTFLLLLP